MSDFMKETEKYVIRREDGKFYYKGSVSSLYGYTEDFGKAYLFDTPRGAKSRLFTANPMKASVRAVTVTFFE